MKPTTIRVGRDAESQPSSTPDSTNPDHYRRLSPEPITVIEDWGLSFHLGNALKYIARAGHKAGADADDDLAKAAWYIERERQRRDRISTFIAGDVHE